MPQAPPSAMAGADEYRWFLAGAARMMKRTGA